MDLVGVSNQKGGVSKTTNSINIAGAGAAEGLDVLAVDTDPQGYLTTNLGLRDAYTADEPNFYSAWMDPNEHDPNGLVVDHDEFDVLPSNIDMFQLEQELVAAGWKVRTRLDMILEQLDGYDLVVVDAPPSLGPINDNVLLATENIIVPMTASEEMIQALDHLLTQISTLERRFKTEITERAVVISNVEYPLDNEQEDIIAWIRDTFEGRCPVYEVRNRAAISRALKNSRSIAGYDEECDQEPVYRELVRDLEVDG